MAYTGGLFSVNVLHFCT